MFENTEKNGKMKLFKNDSVDFSTQSKKNVNIFIIFAKFEAKVEETSTFFSKKYFKNQRMNPKMEKSYLYLSRMCKLNLYFLSD